MKKLIFNLAIIALAAGTVLTGCQSADKKVENAKEEVQDAKKDLQEANQDAVKAAREAEWKLFRDDVDVRIKNNETLIAEYRVKMKKPGKALDAVYAAKIDALEVRNRDLRSRVDTYDINSSDWESFKREFNHDMDELGAAIKDIFVDNKK
ncbi:MAG: hypothetical protein M3Q56_06700 [Bacteroidota bacterium]|nr:hypothetical protein [Bacteroidota bacterium]